MYFYCTCSTNPDKKKDVREGRTPFREVSVDKDGICLDCGYFAVASTDRIDDNGKLYDKLCNEGREWKPERVKGGLSLMNQEQIKKRGASDQQGEDEDGDLDV